MNPNRDRLEKLLGMLGSDFEGERANAGRFIERMAREGKQTVVELIASAFGDVKSLPQAAYYQPAPRRSSSLDTKLSTLKGLLNHPVMNEWERKFISNVTESYSSIDDLSSRQRAVVERILSKIDLWVGT